ncbi:hypothetical protein CBR_g31685 [Chara braunii]|uniref:Uncharacterized protein n=1 Tax=Chara braunii TaxID=69332 RepID=A0A388JXZ4_CHABU|nr:hypothetical protein CBR_g31685 [Chara braunii]|eukprot:GBG62666.1 hypothetical protein CBR_g31685 [Chara braunii]
MSMSVVQVEKALAKVMKYAAEDIHYNDDIEFSLLKERVPRYFGVSVDMRSTIMANDEGCVKARMLLQRFRESPHVRVDNEVEHSPYSLKGVVQWMCNEGMCEDGDVDMTMHQNGGTYAPADFKKLLGTVAKNSDMLVDGSKDELKSGAAEILVVNGIHEALHEVTEFALQGKDLIEFVPARGEDDFISGRPLWGDLLSRVLDRLSLASCDVERQREREGGWKLIVRETSLAIIPDNGETLAAGESISSMAVDVPPMQITDTEEVLLADIFNTNAMERDQCDVGFADADLASCLAIYTDHEDIAEDEEEDEEASSSDVEVSGSDVSSDEADEEDDVYYDLKGAGGQMSKGWAHAVLRLACAFPDPHNVLCVVMKGATPDGALQYAAKMDSSPRVCDCGRPLMSLRTLNLHRARVCPSVVDERAQGKEMFIVDVCGPSNIGAVNLVSDESEDIGAPGNADGKGGPFAEQQPPPAESFHSSRKLAALIFSARGGVGRMATRQGTRSTTVRPPTDILATLTRLTTTTAGVTTAPRTKRVTMGQPKTTEAHLEERVPRPQEEHNARGSPGGTQCTREALPIRLPLADK